MLRGFFSRSQRLYNSMKLLQSITVPHEIVNDEFVTIIKCYFDEGDSIKQGDAVISIETSKMVEDLYATFDGYIRYLCQERDEIKIGEVIVEIHAEPFLERNVPAREIMGKMENSPKEKEVDVVFSRSALLLIEELNINKDIFKGRDFVTTQEVRSLQHQTSRDQHLEDSLDIAFQKLSPFKKREIEYLRDVQSSNLANAVSVFIDITPSLDKLRCLSKFFKNSLLPIVISRLPVLLKEYSEFNAFYKEGIIGFYKNIVIGFAVNLGDGLRILKLPDTNGKNINEIEMTILDTIKQYASKKLTSKDMAGVTFTVSDLSNEGIHFFIPLIPKGQSAILGISAIDEKLQRCTLSLSFDHRVTDGKKASELLRKLKKRIEA